ncbi:hypothetical protein [Kitasatospora purpeofusca]|uniref:Uncharacterized protein n=1 Tax=Kitasatospora purpeofusca TaxID=67352 RepID=A0ABZ1TZ11_9ACTN|nr:hypothetical protein [Kitasatospora purpeofusca]
MSTTSPVEARPHYLVPALAATIRANRDPGYRMWSGKATGGLPLIVPAQEGKSCAC